MKRVRPTSVTVMGILNIVFGSLFLLCVVCAGIGLMMMFSTDLVRLPNGINPLNDLMQFMKREVPGYMVITVGSLVLGLVLDVLLLISGIGLLNMRNWGRVISIIYSIVTLLMQLGTLIFTLAVVNPATERWQREFVQRHGLILPQGGFGGNQASNTLITVASAAIGMMYAIVLLIMMLTPTVSAAFSGRSKEAGYEPGERYDDADDYDRRRQRDGWND